MCREGGRRYEGLVLTLGERGLEAPVRFSEIVTWRFGNNPSRSFGLILGCFLF